MLISSVSRLAQSALTSVLASQGVPSHVAFIMDGNRRFAEAHGRATVEGHTEGYTSLIKALEWCLDLGITAVSVYAFSVENYCRSSLEVQGLMGLAEAKLKHMLEQREVLMQRGVRVRVVGDLSLARFGVQQAALAVEQATRQNSNLTLNICFSYSSSMEMLDAVSGSPRVGSSQPMASQSSSWRDRLEIPDVDLLIRTSGETRLSDFLLWQSRFALLFFSNTLWPDFSFWDLASAVLAWQRARPDLFRIRNLAAGRARETLELESARGHVESEEEQSLDAESDALGSSSFADSGSELEDRCTVLEPVQAQLWGLPVGGPFGFD